MTDKNPPDITSLHDELAVARFRAEFVMSRLAMQVRTDPATARDHLVEVYQRVVGPRNDADGPPTRTQLLLANDIDTFLASRRGEQRPSQVKWEQARQRLERTQTLLGESDPAMWSLRVREAEARALIRTQRDGALRDIELLLTEAGYPDVRNFRISLYATNLAVKLRVSPTREGRARASEITKQELEWRIGRYGPDHPFTLVAESNSLLNDLAYLESCHDEGGFTDEDRDRALALVKSMGELRTRRSGILGARHGGSIRAMSYQARALRLANQHEESRKLAELALIQRGDDPETLRDDTLPAVLHIVVADALIRRRELALQNAQAAYLDQNSSEEVRTHMRRVERLERRRAEDLAGEILGHLDAADDVLGHQQSQWLWVDRAKKVRERLGTVL